jgi:fibronectin-binding autotransporter adhesin
MTTTTGDGDFMTPGNWNDGVPDGTKAAVVAHAMTLSAAAAVMQSLSFTDGSGGKITTTGTCSITSGGDIDLSNASLVNILRSSGNLTITATGDIKSTTEGGVITSTASIGGTLTIVAANIRGNATDSIIKTPTGAVNITATVVPATVAPLHCGNVAGAMTLNGNASGAPGQVALITNGAFIHNGNTTTTASSVGASLYTITGTGSVTVTGNIVSGDTGAAKVFDVNTASTGSVTLNGNVQINTGTIIAASTTGNTTWAINGTMTTTGANSVAIENTAAGIPTITTTGLISVAGAGAKVFNLTSGVPVLHTNGGIAVAAGATLGTIPATMTLRIPGADEVLTSATDFGLSAGVEGAASASSGVTVILPIPM